MNHATVRTEARFHKAHGSSTECFPFLGRNPRGEFHIGDVIPVQIK
jgi:hypothetical protein